MKSHDAFLDWINTEFGMRLHELIAYTQEFYPTSYMDKIEMDIIYGFRNVFMDLDREKHGKEKISKYWNLFYSYKKWICNNGEVPYPLLDLDMLISRAESGNKNIYKYLKTHMSTWFIEGYATHKQWDKFYKLRSMKPKVYDLMTDEMFENKH